MERMMKLQDVLLKAMAKRISWADAAEIIGVTDRTMRRWRERLEERGYKRANGPAQGQAQPAAGAVGYRRGGAGVVPEDLLRPECEALSREAETGAWHPVELHLG